MSASGVPSTSPQDVLTACGENYERAVEAVVELGRSLWALVLDRAERPVPEDTRTSRYRRVERAQVLERLRGEGDGVGETILDRLLATHLVASEDELQVHGDVLNVRLDA